MSETTPEQLVRDFCAAWSRLDLDEIMGYFTADAIYHNMPGPPIEGRDAIRASLDAFVKGLAATEWEIRNIASDRNIVFTERVDRVDTANGKKVALPVAGVFEVHDGKIRHWRDYFDLATYTRAMA